ncbi:hypothetical protein [Tranquillimonas alkanivorans]|uniref:Uncharacterized protein n=1 Tax=Tranquillimonas alkanivorans TaxID=441119 RepID=A0A1I5TU38_9RHOB|nr:hypothetical protein [Tranquillimonas alkanivorans]SFP86107.1 hypothetical protein SAMN04488047_1159 [Tranquillimonas alkanivorans]
MSKNYTAAGFLLPKVPSETFDGEPNARELEVLHSRDLEWMSAVLITTVIFGVGAAAWRFLEGNMVDFALTASVTGILVAHVSLKLKALLKDPVAAAKRLAALDAS